MDNNHPKLLSEQINEGVQRAIIKAVDKHRKLGESIAILEQEQVVILSPEEINQKYRDLLAKYQE